MQYPAELDVAERAALAAGTVIASYYAMGKIAVDLKSDQTPVTAADHAANAAIMEILRKAFPADWVLSEELPDDVARLEQRRVWIIDPLDGTRDFVARTGQFSVHVGLAVDGEAVVGAVYQPVTELMFVAATGHGAWQVQRGERRRLAVSTTARVTDLRVGVSRLNGSDRLARCLTATGLDRHAVPMGASVKHMAVAAGELDAVLCLSTGEQEWDTCAPEVVIREAGGMVTDGDGSPFRYNQRDLAHHRGSIACNAASHAALVEVVKPFLS